ncbi:MAG TPA: energy transducer TonB [Candidatus Angelobacter sp.]|nr:energy transducer TonB [Candidatus Angelobacter sp.]
MIFRLLPYALAAGMLFCGTLGWPWNFGEAQQSARKLKTSVPPEYPELARRLNLKGVARVQVKVAPEGAVKEVRELGGNPVLLEALVRAVKKWKYEPSDKESVVEVQFDFTGS